jgi:hypothetical protein
MAKARVKLGLANLTILELLELALTLNNGLTGNPDFTTPDPTLAVIAALRTAAQNALNARNDAETALGTKNDLLKVARTDLETALTSLADYIDKQSGGVEAKITSTGAQVAATPTPVTDIVQVTGLTGSDGDDDNEIDLGWNRVKRIIHYELERSADPVTATSWQLIAAPTKSKHTVGGLTAGTKYWFRVRAVSGSDKGPWSEPIMRIAM